MFQNTFSEYYQFYLSIINFVKSQSQKKQHNIAKTGQEFAIVLWRGIIEKIKKDFIKDFIKSHFQPPSCAKNY